MVGLYIGERESKNMKKKQEEEEEARTGCGFLLPDY